MPSNSGSVWSAMLGRMYMAGRIEEHPSTAGAAAKDRQRLFGRRPPAEARATLSAPAMKEWAASLLTPGFAL
jgi:hypothetical protein